MRAINISLSLILNTCLQLGLEYNERVSITSLMSILVDDYFDQAVAKRINQLKKTVKITVEKAAQEEAQKLAEKQALLEAEITE